MPRRRRLSSNSSTTVQSRPFASSFHGCLDGEPGSLIAAAKHLQQPFPQSSHGLHYTTLSSSATAESQDTQDCSVSSTTTNLMQDIQNLPIVTNLQIQQNGPVIDLDKKSIMSHPLYPLLAVLLQQCEQASIRPDSPPPLDTFNEELRAYVQRQLSRDDQTQFDGNLSPVAKYNKSSRPSSDERSSTRHPSNRYQHHYSKHDYGKCSRSDASRDHRSNDNGQHRDSSDNSSGKALDYNCELPNSTSSDGVSMMETDRKLKVFSNNIEVDELIIKAIQVLRIHLLELHKVNELCKDFCSRYIHSLKTKFQSDPLIQDSQPSSPGDSEVPSPNPLGIYNSRYFPSANMGLLPPFMCHNSSDMVTPDYRRHSVSDQDNFNSSADLSPTNRSNNYRQSSSLINGHSSAYAPNPDPEGLCYTPNCHLSNYNSFQSNKDDSEDNSAVDPFSQLNPFLSHYGVSSAAAFHARLDGLCVGGKQKRGVLPKRATQIMKQWLFQHLVHPYPTEDEKRHIANQTNLTLLQVNNWFINARRRILQPMLDASNFVPIGNNLNGSHDASADGGHGHENNAPVINKKKKAATSRPSNNRFWPASLVAAAAIHPVAAGLVSSAPSGMTTSTATGAHDTSSGNINRSSAHTVGEPCMTTDVKSQSRTIASHSSDLMSSLRNSSSSTSSKLAIDEGTDAEMYSGHWENYAPPDDLGGGDFPGCTNKDRIKPNFDRQQSSNPVGYHTSPPPRRLSGPDEPSRTVGQYSIADASGVFTDPISLAHNLDSQHTGPQNAGHERLIQNESRDTTQLPRSPGQLNSDGFIKSTIPHQTETSLHQSNLPFHQYHMSELLVGSDIPYPNPQDHSTDCELPNGAHNPYSSKSNSFNPNHYSSVLLNHAQQYSYYLASGMGLTNPATMTRASTPTSASMINMTADERDRSASTYSPYKYPAHSCLNHVSHLSSAFYNPATVLLSPPYPGRSADSSFSSILTGLNGQSNPSGYGFIPSATLHSPSTHPFSYSWANKIRQLAPYANPGFISDPAAPPHSYASSTRDYDLFVQQKTSSPIENGNDMIKPAADSAYSEHFTKQSANPMDYFRTNVPRNHYLSTSNMHTEQSDYLTKCQMAQLADNRGVYNVPLTPFMTNSSAP